MSVENNKYSTESSAEAARKQQPSTSDDNRAKWAANFLRTSSAKALAKELVSNKAFEPPGVTFDAWLNHQELTRYFDVKCADHSRVVLKGRPEEENFIHASWVTTADKQKYIVTQGPLRETVEHFWHMLYQERCRVIVMCGDKNDKERCHPYWPNDVVPLTAGEYTIHLDRAAEKTPHPDVKYRVYKCDGKEGSLLVHHFCLTSWNTVKAPADPAPVIAVHHAAIEKCGNSPIVVHCGSGVGPSSCFVAIDFASAMIAVNASTTMIQMLKELRTQRAQALFSPVDYTFFHVCLLELFAQDKLVQRKSVDKFLSDYKGLMVKWNKKMAEKAEKRRERTDEEERQRRTEEEKEREREKEREKEPLPNKKEIVKQVGTVAYCYVEVDQPPPPPVARSPAKRVSTRGIRPPVGVPMAKGPIIADKTAAMAPPGAQSVIQNLQATTARPGQAGQQAELARALAANAPVTIVNSGQVNILCPSSDAALPNGERPGAQLFYISGGGNVTINTCRCSHAAA